MATQKITPSTPLSALSVTARLASHLAMLNPIPGTLEELAKQIDGPTFRKRFGNNSTLEIVALCKQAGLTLQKQRSPGGGRKPKYGEGQTRVLYMRVPVDRYEACIRAVEAVLTGSES